MKKFISLAVIFILSLPFALVAQDDYTQSTDMGSINWTTGKATAKGFGSAPAGNIPLARKRLEAIRVAKIDAQRNLVELIYGIQLNAESTVENYTLSSDVIRTRVQGFLKGVEYSEPAYYDDGSVEIEATMDIKGEFSNIVLPEQGFSLKPSPTTKPATPETPSRPPSGSNYTGLLVDATGVQVRPAMVPKVLDENGNVVYGPSNISRDYATQVGVVGYTKDVNEAKSNQRVSPYPLTVKALRASGKSSTDLVISNEDARRVRAADANGEFLARCKVIFVLK